MSEAVSWYIIGLTSANLIGIIWLVLWTARIKVDAGEGEEMGHSWDGIVELNSSLPRWWLYMFWITIVWALVYLVLYPGMGSYKGVFGWTQAGQWDAEVKAAEADYGPKLAALANGTVEELAKDPAAHKTGQRLFLTYCSACHGSSGKGGVHFPNLTDDDWLWGGDPATIVTTITGGRVGNMPPGMLAAVGGTKEAEDEVTAYVMSLSGREVDAGLAEKGKAKFAVCGGCHGMDGKGMQALGAPNLTDDIWLHSRLSDKSVEANIRERANNGVVNSTMPSFGAFLGETRVKLLAAYVYGLSHKE